MMTEPSVEFQMNTPPSKSPEQMYLPSEDTATAVTLFVCPLNSRVSAPLCTSKILTIKSSDPTTTADPSGMKAVALTAPVICSKRRSSLPLAKSQTRAVLSSLPDTASCPFGENANDLIQAMCPVSCFNSSSGRVVAPGSVCPGAGAVGVDCPNAPVTAGVSPLAGMSMPSNMSAIDSLLTRIVNTVSNEVLQPL